MQPRWQAAFIGSQPQANLRLRLPFLTRTQPLKHQGMELAFCQAIFLPQIRKDQALLWVSDPISLFLPKAFLISIQWEPGHESGAWEERVIIPGIRGGGRWLRETDTQGVVMRVSIVLNSGRAAATSVTATGSWDAPDSREVESRKKQGDICRARVSSMRKLRGNRETVLECGDWTRALGSLPIFADLVYSVLILRKEIVCTKLSFGFQIGIELGSIVQFENCKYVFYLPRKWFLLAENRINQLFFWREFYFLEPLRRIYFSMKNRLLMKMAQSW